MSGKSSWTSLLGIERSPKEGAFDRKVLFKPVEVREYFDRGEFDTALRYDKANLEQTAGLIADRVNAYDPKRSPVPFSVAQMVVYVYESVRLAEQGEECRDLDVGLEDLTEHGLRNAMRFCSSCIERYPEVGNLGGLVKVIGAKYRNLLFMNEVG